MALCISKNYTCILRPSTLYLHRRMNHFLGGAEGVVNIQTLGMACVEEATLAKEGKHARTGYIVASAGAQKT